MVKITVYQDRDQQIVGFDCRDHAGYAQENDIVCAGVSALVISTVNAIETLTDAACRCESEEESGTVTFRLAGKANKDAQLLLQSMILGLQNMESNYEEYMDLIFEEVSEI